MAIMFEEFREFAFKGNVIDLAVGVIIGAAFGKIVTSLVNNIFMPILGLILGKVDFSNLFIVLNGQQVASLKEAADKGIPVFAYGMFINTVIEFLIIAFCLFIVIKQVNRFKKPVVAASGPSAEEKLLDRNPGSVEKRTAGLSGESFAHLERSQQSAGGASVCRHCDGVRGVRWIS